MKKIDLKTVCDSTLKDELEKRGYLVKRIPRDINAWKHYNKIIQFERTHKYWYLGETKDFSKSEFEETVKTFLDVHPDDEIDIYVEYFKLEPHISNNVSLVVCKKDDVGAIEFWRV